MKYLGVAVVLAVIAVVIWSRMTRARTNPHDGACIPNLRTIQEAKRTWALENRKTTNDVPTDADLFGPQKYLATKPVCPAGGSYTLGAVGEPVRCSVAGHTL